MQVINGNQHSQPATLPYDTNEWVQAAWPEAALQCRLARSISGSSDSCMQQKQQQACWQCRLLAQISQAETASAKQPSSTAEQHGQPPVIGTCFISCSTLLVPAC
jgi:hypothetical protein